MTEQTPPPGRPQPVRIRRAPRILSFLLTGAVLGAIAALVATFAFPPNDVYPAGQVFGFLLLLGVALGAALGGVVAIVFDAVLSRRTRDATAVREVTAPPDEEPGRNGHHEL